MSKLQFGTIEHVHLLPLIDAESEQRIIGTMIADSSSVVDFAAILKPGDFYLVRHELMFTAMVALDEREADINDVAIVESLKAVQMWDAAYSIDRVQLMMDKCLQEATTYDTAERLCWKVKALAQQRQLLVLGDDIQALAFRNLPIDAMMQELEGLVAKHTERVTPHHISIKDLAARHSQTVDDVMSGKALGLPRVEIGIDTVDNAMDGGLARNEVTVIGGPPSIGKSRFLLTLLRHGAQNKKRILLFPAEMTQDEVMAVLLNGETGIPIPILNSFFAGLEAGSAKAQSLYSKYNNGIAKVVNWDIVIAAHNTQNMTPAFIRRIVRQEARKAPIDAVFIDGLVYMKPDTPDRSREVEFGNIMDAFGSLSRDYKIPIVVTHHLKRGIKGEPSIEDFAFSAYIERLAQNIILLHREDVDMNGVDMGTQVIFAKARNAQRQGKRITMSYDYRHGLYRSIGTSLADKIQLTDGRQKNE